MEYIRFSSLISSTMTQLENEKKNKINKHPAYEKIKEGKYIYNNETPENYIFRAGDYQADNIKTIGLRLISEVVWINDLEYKLVLNHINNSKLTELQVGDTLHAKITAITDEYFAIETSFDGQSKKSKLWFAS